MNVFSRAFLFVVLMISSVQAMAESVNDELTDMLNQFLAGASSNDVAAHERFWADDLIYTSSAGERFTKADIMKSVTTPPATGGDEADVLYTAEEIIIHPYGTMAVVAFELVGTSSETGKDGSSTTKESHYLNTGTFLQRDGIWQVVAWQATHMAEPKADEG